MKNQKNLAESVSKNLNDIFIEGLKDMYWVENTLVKALPKMFENARDTRLRTAIKDHLAQTKEHVTRLEQVFEQLGEKAEAQKCFAMEGILKEGDEILIIGKQTRPYSATMAAAAMLNSFCEIEADTFKTDIDTIRFSMSYDASKMWPKFVLDHLEIALTLLDRLDDLSLSSVSC